MKQMWTPIESILSQQMWTRIESILSRPLDPETNVDTHRIDFEPTPRSVFWPSRPASVFYGTQHMKRGVRISSNPKDGCPQIDFEIASFEARGRDNLRPHPAPRMLLKKRNDRILSGTKVALVPSIRGLRTAKEHTPIENQHPSLAGIVKC
jgi:hypothetical protein